MLKLHKIDQRLEESHKNSKEKLVKCANEVARLYAAWTISMKFGTLVQHAHGYKMLPQIFNFCPGTYGLSKL